MWQASAGTGSLLGLQRTELGLQGLHLMGENCQVQWVSFPSIDPTLGWMEPPAQKDPKIQAAFLTLAVYENHGRGGGV